MTSNIKNTQLPRVGYTYQDFICIQKLIEWFHDPDQYLWMRIEGAEAKDAKLIGLDDVIALSKDGSYELIQVKFTTDSSRNDLALDFEWLLDKAKRGKSLLQKWSKDVEVYSAKGNVSVATLKTNRIPDSDFQNCLNRNIVDIDKIPKKFLARIEEQLGGYKNAKTFFELFSFDHSQPEIDDLEKILFDSIVPDHSTAEGWFRFLKAVERWATRKNEPLPDGYITIDHIRDLFSAGIYRSIYQFFDIPKGYVPPVEQFHQSILEKTNSTGCWVISGRPGMGKSTYLSYLTEELMRNNIPVIRHHYSISAQSVVDRISYPNAARSLQHQLQIIFPSAFTSTQYEPEKLIEWMLVGADEARKNHKKLVLIIDGLDHVSRERSEITQLEHLINNVLRVQDSICIILGTQPVGDNQLPAKLISSVPRDQYWLDFPAMTLNAIQCWLEVLIETEQVSLIGHKDQAQSQIAELSEAFLKVSGGYPLHLIYSMKRLTLRSRVIDKYDVERLPACPSGDIHAYYDELWANLSPGAKQILFLIACVEFSWPDRNHIGYCFEDSLLFSDAFDEIQHLVERRRSGIAPFHGSMLVYVRNRHDFQESAPALLRKVDKWLKDTAPEYWRWCWEWVVKAKLGNIEPLLSGVTRDWLVESFCRGHPLQHIEHIMSTAEAVAFESRMYSKLVQLRLIKIRLINGPEFQLQEYEEFLRCALKVREGGYGLYWRADNIRIIADKEIAVISSLFRGVDDSVAYECYEEIIRRLKFFAGFEDDSQHSRVNSLVDVAIDILTDVSNPNLDAIQSFLGGLYEQETYFRKILNKLISSGNSALILEFEPSAIPKGAEEFYWDYFVLACCINGIMLADRPEKEIARSSDFAAIQLMMAGNSIDTGQLIEPTPIDSADDVSDIYLHKVFFHALAKQINKQFHVEDPSEVIVDGARSLAEKAVKSLEFCARRLAETVLEGVNINAFSIFKAIEKINLQRPKSHDYKTTLIGNAISRAINRISIDIHVLFNFRDQRKCLGTELFEEMSAYSWFELIGWLNSMSQRNINIAPSGISSQAIQNELSELKDRKDDTATLANDGLELAKLSLRLSLGAELVQCLRLSAHHTLGYGHRKDTTFSELYDAIDTCSKHGVGDVGDWLRRVAPFTNGMFDFTEREIRHIPGWYIDLLAKHLPERLVDEFDYHINNQNWHVTDHILEKWVKYSPLNTPADSALVRSITSYQALVALKEKADVDQKVKELYENQSSYLGGLPPPPRDRASNTTFEEKAISAAIENFPPEKLVDLNRQLVDDGIYSADAYFESWINYWVENGRAHDVIKAYDQLCEDVTNIPYLMRRSLHSIFALSHKLEGPSKAYGLAVRAIRVNDLWGRWSGSKADEHLKEYARLYSSNWESLLRDTIGGDSTASQGTWIIVPSSKLVVYLIAAGQAGLACEVTEAMLRALEDEIAHLPLPALHWYDHPVKSDQIAAKLLLLYYKWPDRVARLRAANEIAKIIDSEAWFREIYLEHLGSLKYEIDVSDLLSILILSTEQHFSIEQLSSVVQYPSVLSFKILNALGYSVEIRSNLYYSTFHKDQYGPSERYEKSKNGMAPLYFNVIDDLGSRLNYPLSSHMAAEWNEISTRAQFLYFDPYGFCGHQFYPQELMSCSLSTHAESVVLSAYLRTLAFAHERLGASQDEIVALAEEAAPFGGVCSSIQPSPRPTGWPSELIFDQKSDLPSEVDLNAYIDELLKNESKILRASGPVAREAHGVSCDLEIITFYADKNVVYDPKSVYQSLVGKTDQYDGINKVAKSSYPRYFGRWEVDWLLRGYFQPNFAIGPSISYLEVTSNSVQYCVGDAINAIWKYWMFDWFPASHRGMGSSLGTYLSVSNEIWEKLVSGRNRHFYMLAKLSVIDKRTYASESTLHETYIMRKVA